MWQDENGRPVRRTFVLKTYHNDKFERLYDNEYKALTMLQNAPSPSVITYYASFRQNGTYNLVLEYADRGDLWDFYQTTPPPNTSVQVVQFWKNLFEVFKGLERVHQLMVVDDAGLRG
jgi:serine/threonine protein kinase